MRILEPNLYRGGGSAKALHRVMDPSGQVGLWKVYKEEVSQSLDVEELLRIIRWPITLACGRRAELCASMALPWAVVVDGLTAVGVLMPEAPPQFFYSDRRGNSRQRTVGKLSVPRVSACTEGRHHFVPPHKLALLGRLLTLLADLHELGVVIGDLQPENILVTEDRHAPAVMVLDCDSLWVGGRQAFGDVLDPELWRPPFAQGVFTEQTDLFKFALLVIRCLQEDNRVWCADRAVLSEAMPSHHIDLLTGLFDPNITANATSLRVLASNWTRRIGLDGTFYNCTDTYSWIRWQPSEIQPSETQPPGWQAPDGLATGGLGTGGQASPATWAFAQGHPQQSPTPAPNGYPGYQAPSAPAGQGASTGPLPAGRRRWRLVVGWSAALVVVGVAIAVLAVLSSG